MLQNFQANIANIISTLSQQTATLSAVVRTEQVIRNNNDYHL